MGYCAYMKLGLPNMILSFIEILAFDSMVLLSGYFKKDDQAAAVILNSIINTVYQVAVGYEQASCSLIGQEIGRGRVDKARLYLTTFQFLTTPVLIITSLAVYFEREAIIRLFTQDEGVVDSALSVIVILCVILFPDG
eukprot:CAMPEP_0168610500 /NCGR_PEP_ID=MMETSP0449_2-20121227/1821_1 /TAXON_ID=1082188 /ORGANISM="Strombidium rassoulzadegani, Strain ras09" /LENGTH=137 /DNA_ID=CAMNT_0008650811 /DNA_START=816 /DNA_END=1229 /DNA_ORIENTATION=-